MDAIGMIRRVTLLLTVGGLLVACCPSGTSAPVPAPAAVSQIAASIPPMRATIGIRGTANTVPTNVATTRPATRAATASGTTPAVPVIGCDNTAVTDVVARFLDAYNAGDQPQLLSLFPARAATRGIGIPGEETYFQRYWDTRKPSLRDEDGFAAYARADLPPYWALRHAQHEHLQLLSVEGGRENSFGLAGIGFMLIRQADDLPEHIVVGKAEIDCRQSTLTVWSMGPQEQPQATPNHP